MPMTTKKHQVSFYTDDDVYELLQQCDNKSRMMNDAVRFFMAQAGGRTIKKRVEDLERQMADVVSRLGQSS